MALALIVPAVGASCGARTSLETTSFEPGVLGDGGPADAAGLSDTSAPLDTSAGSETGASEPACPVCPAVHVCSGPWACREGSVARAYRFCKRDGLSNDIDLDPRFKGVCANLGGSWACAEVGPLPMCEPAPERCSSSFAGGGFGCGEIACGTGCTCLCENFCWCYQ
jgi:hypothetical protein